MVCKAILALDFPLSHAPFFSISKNERDWASPLCLRLGCSSWEYPYVLAKSNLSFQTRSSCISCMKPLWKRRPQGELFLPMSLPLLSVLHSLQAWMASGGHAITSLGVAHLWNYTIGRGPEPIFVFSIFPTMSGPKMNRLNNLVINLILTLEIRPPPHCQCLTDRTWLTYSQHFLTLFTTTL